MLRFWKFWICQCSRLRRRVSPRFPLPLLSQAAELVHSCIIHMYVETCNSIMLHRPTEWRIIGTYTETQCDVLSLDVTVCAGGSSQVWKPPLPTLPFFTDHMGGCRNYGPFLGTLNIRCRIIIGIQKRDPNFDNHPYEMTQVCFTRRLGHDLPGYCDTIPHAS